MQQIRSKQVIAWGQGLIDEEIFRKVREELDGRTYRGGPYSKKKDTGIENTKITGEAPVAGFGAGRDIGVESEWVQSPQKNLDPTSGYDKDVELGYGGRANDETGPGNTRIQPETSPQVTELLSDNPTTINSLFRPDTTDRDKGTFTKTRQYLEKLYNTVPVRKRRF